MRKLFENWKTGIMFLLFDDLISFFAYITIALTEIAFLWAYGVENALPFTILLLVSILNIILSSLWKEYVEGSKFEQAQALLYVITAIVLVLGGLYYGVTTTLLLGAFLIGVTWLWILLRMFQNTIFLGYPEDSIQNKVNKLRTNTFLYILSYVVLFGLPLGAFVYFVAQTSLPIFFKVLIPIVYIALTPFIAYMEDNLSAWNVFELAKCTWDSEYEKMVNQWNSEINKSNNVTSDSAEEKDSDKE